MQATGQAAPHTVQMWAASVRPSVVSMSDVVISM